jgi:hypothetical protein
MTPEPRQIVEQIEGSVSLPQGGGGDRPAGYAIIGLPFRSGHVLALRRFPASPAGPGFTSVWHRSPLGIWTFFSTIRLPRQRRSRHCSSGEIMQDVVTPIEIDWSGPKQFSIRIGERDLRWNVKLAESAASRLVNAVSGWIPDSWRTSQRAARAIGSLSQCVLGTGPMSAASREVLTNPGRVWLVAASTARVKGKDIGEPGALEKQARLHEFLIPQRGLFAITKAYLA